MKTFVTTKCYLFLIVIFCACNPNDPKKSPTSTLTTSPTLTSNLVLCSPYQLQRYQEVKALFANDKYQLKDDWTLDSLFRDSLTYPQIKSRKVLQMDISAFKQQFHPCFKDSTWVMGYRCKVSTTIYHNPTIVVDYNIPMRIKWLNTLNYTLVNNARYNFPNKWYPIVYDMNIPPTAIVPMTFESLYPKKTNQLSTIDSTMGMSPYYSTSVHLHGANVKWENDGYPTDKIITNVQSITPTTTFTKQLIGDGLFTASSFRNYTYPNSFPEGDFLGTTTQPIFRGITAAPNKSGQHGGILWYHDHSMMRTATNVYAGLAGMYIVKGQNEEKLIKETLDLDDTRDIPLLIADKSFTKGGHLYYETTQNCGTEAGQPEFFGNTMTVNGKISPYQNVQSTWYRYRIVNACNARTMRLSLHTWNNTLKKIDTLDNCMAMMRQIGTEGGLIGIDAATNQPAAFPIITKHTPLTLLPGERADLLIDFSKMPLNSSVILMNWAVNEPYQEDKNIVADSLQITNYLLKLNIKAKSPKKVIANLEEGLKKMTQSHIYSALTNNLGIYKKGTTYYVDSIANRQVESNNNGARDNFSLYKNGKMSSFLKKKPKNISAIPKKNDDDILLSDREDRIRIKSSSNSNTTNSIEQKDFIIMEASSYDDLKKRPFKEFKQYVEQQNIQTHLSFPMAFIGERTINGADTTIKLNDWNSEEANKNILQVQNKSIQIWAIYNDTQDAHPIHIHLNRFKVLGRSKGKHVNDFLHEFGWKDVVHCYPKETTYIAVQFLLRDDQLGNGQFVYHCHILEHEDMTMMRRVVVIK
jgi:FtsP/CotA-like multicopper oxidase with cupredoxin domain